MRDKSVLKFQAKIRELTIRHHNLDLSVIEKLNRVIRGTANYFTRSFPRVVGISRSWIRGFGCGSAA
jgi:hypothetical protein